MCGAPVLGTLIFFEKFPVLGIEISLCVGLCTEDFDFFLKNSLYWGLKFPCVWAPVLRTLIFFEKFSVLGIEISLCVGSCTEDFDFFEKFPVLGIEISLCVGPCTGDCTEKNLSR